MIFLGRGLISRKKEFLPLAPVFLFCRHMDYKYLPPMGIRSCTQRISVSDSITSPYLFRKPSHNTLLHAERDTSTRCSGGSTSKVSQQRFLFPLLPHPEEERRWPILQLSSQQIHLSFQVSDGHPFLHNPFLRSHKLICNSQFARHILPHYFSC